MKLTSWIKATVIIPAQAGTQSLLMARSAPP